MNKLLGRYGNRGTVCIIVPTENEELKFDRIFNPTNGERIVIEYVKKAIYTGNEWDGFTKNKTYYILREMECHTLTKKERLYVTLDDKNEQVIVRKEHFQKKTS